MSCGVCFLDSVIITTDQNTKFRLTAEDFYSERRAHRLDDTKKSTLFSIQKKEIVVISRPSESCYWTHIKQIMKQENNLFSRTVCNGMPIFFINSNRYFQYRLQLVISKHFHNYTVVTYDDIYTVSQSIYNFSWVAIDEYKNDPGARKPAQREENRYINWDQQRIYASVVICWLMRWKVMILLYLEE